MNEADALAAKLLGTVEYVGGPWCGMVRYFSGEVRWMSCWQESESAIHVYELARGDRGQAVYQYQGVGHAQS